MIEESITIFRNKKPKNLNYWAFLVFFKETFKSRFLKTTSTTLCPIHTADELSREVELRHVGAVTEHSLRHLVTKFTIVCAVEIPRLVTSDDIMTSLLKKLSIWIKIHIVKPL